ncbi:hypothetical protein AB0L86_25065 [Micromonospora musae]|uniref:hypothetical protein n=1 Tax=Micromonospora musae TaxID=1894970 RepID=UPI003440508A
MSATLEPIQPEEVNVARTIHGLHLPINRRPGVRACRSCRDDRTCPDDRWANALLNEFSIQHAALAVGVF